MIFCAKLLLPSSFGVFDFVVTIVMLDVAPI